MTFSVFIACRMQSFSASLSDKLPPLDGTPISIKRTSAGMWGTSKMYFWAMPSWCFPREAEALAFATTVGQVGPSSFSIRCHFVYVDLKSEVRELR
jgi:hypothetical protein